MKKPVCYVTYGATYVKEYKRYKIWDPERILEEDNITDKIVIVTGSNAGIGRETAYQLARRGAKVIMACRNKVKAEEAKNYILEKVPNAKLEIMQLDVGSLSAVREFVKEFESKYDKLHILVNNAGALSSINQRQTTMDGFEFHMGVNHLGPFLLIKLLLPSLKRAAPSRVVCVQSSAALYASSTAIVEDFMFEKDYKLGPEGMIPYDRSKLAALICTRRLAQEVEEVGDVKILQVCPGLVTTDILAGDGGKGSLVRTGMAKMVGLKAEQGCETSVYCATNRNLPGKGEFYRYCKQFQQGNDFIEPKDEEENQHVEFLYQKSLELINDDSVTQL